MTRAVIALGANLGEPVVALRRAVRDLRADPHLLVRSLSGVWRTVALTRHGYDAAEPEYANQVMVVDTDLDAPALLRTLHRVEQAHGRVRRERWGARTLDLDLIDMDGVSRCSPWLPVPHPQAARRLFVLGPWAEAEPAARLGGVPVATLRDRLAEGER